MKIWVAGSRGMVGFAVARELAKHGHEVIDERHELMDLLDPYKPIAWAVRHKPEALVLCAAVVGGIADNAARPAVYARENLLIHVNAIHAAVDAGAKIICVIGSSCMYPRDCPQPMCEEYLWTGMLEPTNRAYAAAKLAAVETALAYGRQHGIAVCVPVAPNLFGERDRFDRVRGHFVAGMIQAFCDAEENGEDVVLWGSGTPRREAMCVDDFAIGVRMLIEKKPDAGIVNMGVGSDYAIGEWAEHVRRAARLTRDVGIVWDRSKPDGMPRKLMDSSRARGILGYWPLAHDLDTQLMRACCAYRASKPGARA